MQNLLVNILDEKIPTPFELKNLFSDIFNFASLVHY